MKKWITFDLDGTIMQNPFGKYVFPEIEEKVHALCGQKKNVIDELVEEHQLRMQEQRFVEAYDWDDIVKSFLDKAQITCEMNIEELVRKHSTLPKIYLLEENILHTLQMLIDRGYSLAAVTNGFYKYQFPVMKTLGLDQYFEEIITPEKAGYGKPDVRIFDGLKQNGDVITAHIGDRLDHDVQLANLYGTASIWIERKIPQSFLNIPPDERINHIAIKDLCKQKWMKEANEEILPVTLEPDIVIASISELSIIFK
ncbi:HAD family hydrolase [Heyndrickxia sp. NPDC080065]|uniref:HAD family hydrolase n=1 Tax=Heyndrickxia sp. NPDC080065 TaxID=3390568 RepID=UPI003CFF1BE5